MCLKRFTTTSSINSTTRCPVEPDYTWDIVSYLMSRVWRLVFDFNSSVSGTNIVNSYHSSLQDRDWCSLNFDHVSPVNLTPYTSAPSQRKPVMGAIKMRRKHKWRNVLWPVEVNYQLVKFHILLDILTLCHSNMVFVQCLLGDKAFKPTHLKKPCEYVINISASSQSLH